MSTPHDKCRECGEMCPEGMELCERCGMRVTIRKQAEYSQHLEQLVIRAQAQNVRLERRVRELEARSGI